MRDPQITFARLTTVDCEAVRDLLDEPRNARHLPLAHGGVTLEDAAAWIAAKDRQWDEHGFGPWAILLDDEFAGWGGFQAEENGADFALVLRPEFWGHGEAVLRQALDHGFRELGLTEVLIALPHSRRPDRAVARHGFVPDGVVTYAGVRFRQYRLRRAAWSAGSHPSAVAGADGPALP